MIVSVEWLGAALVILGAAGIAWVYTTYIPKWKAKLKEHRRRWGIKEE